MINNLKDKDNISLYELFNNDILITVFLIFLFLSTGIQWLIPVPPYPYVPFWGLSEYMALLLIYIIIRKLIDKNYQIKLPEITKKITINLKKLKEYKNFEYTNILTHKKNNTFLLLLFLIASIFIIIPLNDIPLSMLCSYICYNYFKNDKKSLYTGVTSLIILLVFYIYIISKLIINRQNIGSYIYKFKNVIIIFLLVLIILMINKINTFLNKYSNAYKEYVTLPDNFKFSDLFKK